MKFEDIKDGIINFQGYDCIDEYFIMKGYYEGHCMICENSTKYVDWCLGECVCSTECQKELYKRINEEM